MPESKKVRSLYIVIAVLAAVIIWMLASVYTRTSMVQVQPGRSVPVGTIASEGSKSMPTVSSEDGLVKVPLAELSTGKASFFRLPSGVQFFLIKVSDANVLTALNACYTCYAQHKGYSQRGDVMTCNSCRKTTPLSRIGMSAQECTPIPISPTTIADGNVTIPTEVLERGQRYFR